MDELQCFDIMAGADEARKDHDAFLRERNQAVLEQVRAMVSVEVFAQVEGELADSELTFDYKIVVAPAGAAQDNGFALGDVYVEQFAGACEDDFYGTVALPLPDGQYFQFGFNN